MPGKVETFLALAVFLLVTQGRAVADYATLEDMDRHVARQIEEDRRILANLKPQEIWVGPDGKPDNAGTQDSPLDFRTAFTDGDRVKAGSLVWVMAGRYEVGALHQVAGVKGARELPVIYRAAVGARATIFGELTLRGDHTWLWGLEIAGPPASGVNVLGGDGIKVINCVLHGHGAAEPPETRKPTGHGIGGWDVGDDHEFYGNLIYWNGRNWLDHGIYSQNQAKHSAKRYVDNIVFENSGWGLHLYGSAPYLAGLYLEGNFAFATGLIPRGTEPGPAPGNILVGGSKPLKNVILRDNCAYHPKPDSKRCVDIGYTGGPNRNILVERNYFMGGTNALEIKKAAQAVVRGNTFWAPNGMVAVSTVPPDAAKAALAEVAKDAKSGMDPAEIAASGFGVLFESNRYVDNGRFDLARFRESIGTGQTDQVVPGRDGRPADVAWFYRVNRYEPERVHLAVFNWPRTPTVKLDLKDILQTGEGFRVVDVHDVWGEPSLTGVWQGKPVELAMTGPWAPEFACFVLFRQGPAKR